MPVDSIESLTIRLKITDQCSQNCLHCPDSQLYSKSSQHLSFQKIEALLNALTEHDLLKCSQIIITGGEPLEHPELLKIMQLFHRSLPNHLVLATNGILLRGELLQELAKYPPDEFWFSLEGDEATHDQLRARPGNYRHTEKLIKELKSILPDTMVSTNVIVSASSLEMLSENIEKLSRLPLTFIRLNRLMPTVSFGDPPNNEQWGEVTSWVKKYNYLSRTKIHCIDRAEVSKMGPYLEIESGGKLNLLNADDENHIEIYRRVEATYKKHAG